MSEDPFALSGVLGRDYEREIVSARTQPGIWYFEL